MPGDAAPRRRRRPQTRNGRPTLTADLIAHAMLDLAGTHGFRAVTMRVLAEHLGVTVRALYNYVEDRQQVVDRAAELFVASWPAVPLDPDRWEDSLTAYVTALRAAYRRHPRALLVSLDEQVGDLAVHPHRLTHPDALLGMLRAIGLSIADAQIVHGDLAMRVFGFVLLVDHRHDLGHPVMEHTPVPPQWLTAHPQLDVPHVREAVDAAPLMSVDEAFDQLVRGLIILVRHLLGSNENAGGRR